MSGSCGKCGCDSRGSDCKRKLPEPTLKHALTIRQYGEGVGDFQMVSGWLKGHDEEDRFTEVFLPPVGVIVEDAGEPVAVCWMYLAAGIGVGFIEWPITRPGLGLKRAKAALGAAFGALELIAKQHDYSLLVATTSKPLAHAMERFFDFQPVANRVQLIKRIDVDKYA